MDARGSADELRNFDPAHYSAARFLDISGNETGAVGYGNTGATAYADMDYLESFGLTKPFYFVSSGLIVGGMNKTTGDFIWTDSTGTNTMFWIHRLGVTNSTVNVTNELNVGGVIRAGTGAADGSTSSGRAVTRPAGYLEVGDFDASESGTAAMDSANVHGTNFVAHTKNHFATGPISFDAGANGSGFNYESTSPGGVACVSFGVGSAITGMFTSANQAWFAYPSMDIGPDTADGTKDGFAMFKVHGAFGTDVKSKSANYTTDMGDSSILIASSGKTVTLPDAAAHCTGRQYVFKLTVSGSATIATTSNAAVSTNLQLIDASTNYTLSAQYKYVWVQSDGTQWWIIANN